MTGKYLIEMMVEGASDTEFLVFSRDLSEEKMDQFTAPSNVFQQRYFRAQYTHYAQSANGRANFLNSYVFFFRTQKKN